MNIEIKKVSKTYGKKSVLRDISFRAQGGRCVGILGGNGCGKSTLLSILAGVQSCDSGEFLYDGKNLFDYPLQRSELIGYVPQGTPLIEELNAYDNLLLWYDKKSLKEELDQGVLAMLGIDKFLKTPVSKMSGGMKKRLSIGCAIAKRPPVLLLDEPMAALDLSCKQTIIEYLSRHKERGGILLLATHDVLELELCDECYIIKNGTISPFLYEGDIEKLVKRL
ncbi:MAG: ABC transporter ATP-binding protein [Ruminococcaceae bacterium]|nr:ABC transporter ATP-binding protein [Oscillospiraceae bacterium]